MAESDSTSPIDSSKKENLAPPHSAKLAELNESRTELLSRIQSLKQDLQNWRSKLDTQVQSHRNELVELRKSLNVEVNQLRSEFQGLRTTLQQQQEDVTASLKNLGLQDPSIDAEIYTPKPMDAGTVTGHEVSEEGNNAELDQSGSSTDKNTPEESTGNENGTDVHPGSTLVGAVDISR